MSEWIPKNNKIKFGVTLIILSIILYFGVLLVLSKETAKLENFYQNSESKTVKKEKFLAIKKLIGENSEYIKTLDNFFVKKDTEIGFIEQIESVAKYSGIDFEIVSIDDGGKSQSDQSKDIKVKVNIKGSWQKLMTFLGKMEKMPFGVSVDNINLDAESAGMWSGFVDFSIFKEK